MNERYSSTAVRARSGSIKQWCAMYRTPMNILLLRITDLHGNKGRESISGSGSGSETHVDNYVHRSALTPAPATAVPAKSPASAPSILKPFVPSSAETSISTAEKDSEPNTT